VRARCGGGAAAWVAGVLAAPGIQGDWRLGQQEIQCWRASLGGKVDHDSQCGKGL